MLGTFGRYAANASSKILGDHDYPDTVYLFYFPGGAVAGYYQAVVMDHMESLWGAHSTNFIDIFSSVSAGCFCGMGLVVPSPDNPDLPSLWAKDVINLFHDVAPRIFEGSPTHYKNMTKTEIGNIVAEENPGIGETAVKILEKAGLHNGKIRHFNQAALGECLQSIGTKAHMNQALKSTLTFAHTQNPEFPIVYGRIDRNLLPNPQTHLLAGYTEDGSIYDAMMSTTAGITLFPDHEDAAGRHNVDLPFVETPLSTVKFLRKSLPPTTKIKLVVIGTGSSHVPINPYRYRELGLLGLFQADKGGLFLRMSQNHLMAAHMPLILDEGCDVTIIDKESTPTNLHEEIHFPTRDSTAADPETMEKRRWFAEKMIEANADTLKRLVDEMHRQQVKRGTKINYGAPPERRAENENQSVQMPVLQRHP